MKQKKNYFLIKDLLIISLSILFAIIIGKTGILVNILTSTKELELFGSFIAGMFFTSAFTTAPAIVVLGEIAQVTPIWFTAFFGAIGAASVDFIIFRFLKEKFSKHLIEFIKQKKNNKLKFILKIKAYKWLTILIGGLIIASPLPDELGIAILGFSKMKSLPFVLFSFISNFTGIMLIGLISKALL